MVNVPVNAACRCTGVGSLTAERRALRGRTQTEPGPVVGSCALSFVTEVLYSLGPVRSIGEVTQPVTDLGSEIHELGVKGQAL